MADAKPTDAGAPAGEATARELEGGSYEVIRARLDGQAKDLGERAEKLNAARMAAFGGTELTIAGQCRVRTENNCVPRDIVQVGGRLLFGYNVFLGLRTETAIEDVFGLRTWSTGEEGVELDAVPLADGGPRFLADPQFVDQFRELYRFYKTAKLLQLTRSETKLLAIFQIGAEVADVRVFRWELDARGEPKFIDNRGERDFAFPSSHDFEWRACGREDRREGRHPHVSIRDKIFVETVGGDLTVKIENNTESGEGIFSEPVDEVQQGLDDALIEYAEVGPLILLKIRPYREDVVRYLVYSSRTQRVVRIDAVGRACVSLPEDHGIIFPGGFFLQDGQHKVFDGDYARSEFFRLLRSPNGEDVLYVFLDRNSGVYSLLPYNLIRREIQTPIRCNGYSLFDDGKMVVFRASGEEPTKVHPMQVWKTPFVSAEHAAAAPIGSTPLHKLGNADLVRGISDCLSVRRFILEQSPSRQIYEDLIATVTRIGDAYHWIGSEDAFAMGRVLVEIRRTAELVVDEFEKVVALRKQAATALGNATKHQQEIISAIRPDSWTQVAEYMDALARLRTQRGALITLREQRYIDTAALAALEQEVTKAFGELSGNTVRFLARDDALRPVTRQLDELLERVAKIEKTNELVPHAETLSRASDGLAVLSEVAANLQVDDPTLRTRILEGVSDAFAHCNRVRAVMENRRKELLSHEGKAEFAAQFKLFSQAVQSAIALCDTPERCDEQSSRLMVQLEELEARFSEFDEFVGELTRKREEVYEAFGQRKQMLVDDRQRKVSNLWQAAERIISGLQRRATSFTNADELNSFFAADGMVVKLRELGERIADLGDSVKADEVGSRLKSARQDALRALRDKLDLFEGGADLIKLGKHRFTVNTQAIELTMVPHEGGMALGVTGTDFVELVSDPELEATRPYWSQQIVSETEDVYRAEYLAASIVADAELGRNGLDATMLAAAVREGGLVELVRRYAADRYQEGYDRGVHDADAAAILGKLLALQASAGLLRFSAAARTAALLHWVYSEDPRKEQWHRRAMSLLRLRSVFARTDALDDLTAEIATSIRERIEAGALPMPAAVCDLAARYLVEELAVATPRFVVSADAVALRDGLFRRLTAGAPAAVPVVGSDGRRSFEEDLQGLADVPVPRFEVALAWLEGWIRSSDDPDVTRRASAAVEAAGLIATAGAIDREESAGLTFAEVSDLLGQHPRVVARKLELRVDEFGGRLDTFRRERVPAFARYRELRQAIVERERARLRLGELRPKVLTSFVRNRLVDEVYLPLVGDNLAKQMGAAGEGKRTDLMGMLLLISPPGYGKTTLMEYVASRLGLAFVKVNGPALGHSVTSIDPAEAPNATARQEVEKINLALEMGNNVMLYLDDIQHTNPELLQKFISLCDAQRRIEGVWKGRTRTYDLRGKKFCVVMAGNPYTESGDKFQIPDMLANRADTYNLGDILQGKDDLFALSYIENAVTSNRVLAPLATREPADLHKLVRLAQGEEVATSELSQAYSAVEISEITAVLQRLFKVQKVLLAVNKQYIASASMDDRFRTEPPFKLQGSYRNMNKLAEKVVPAMNDDELERLVDDHYASESQTLTTGAEHNLLKLAELRGRMSAEAKARWEAIRKEFARLKMVGGGDDDPVSRVTAGLANLGEGLRGIEAAMAAAATAASSAAGGIKFGEIEAHLYGIQQSIAAGAAALAKQAIAPKPDPHAAAAAPPASGRDELLAGYLDRLDRTLKVLAAPQLEIRIENLPPPGIEELLAQQIAIIERTLVPLVRTTNQSLGNPTAVDLHVQELLRLMRAIDERLRAVVMGPVAR